MISEIGLRYGRYLPESVKSGLYPVYYYVRDIERYLAYAYRQRSEDEMVETKHGFRMNVDKSDFVQRRYLTGEAESEEELVEVILREMRRTNGDFLDVGANVGFYSLLFVSHSDGSVCAFEPLNYNVRKLECNLELNGFESVKIFPIGLSNRSGKSKIYYHPFNRGAAGDSTTSGGLTFLQNSEVVRFEKLDKIEGISDNIGLAKIDVEGYELDVLKGAERTIREQHPSLFIELHPEMLDTKGQSVADLVEYVFELGYDSIYLIQEDEDLSSSEARQFAEKIEENHAIWCRSR